MTDHRLLFWLILFWLPLGSCAVGAIGCLRARVPLRDPRWRALAVVAAVAVLASVLAPDWAPWITAATFAAVIWVPGALQRLVNAAIRRQDFVRAAWLAWLTRTLTPHFRSLDNQQWRLLDALALAARGRLAEADAALDILRQQPVPAVIRLAATGQLCRLRGDWSLLPPGVGEAGDTDPVGIAMRLRALDDSGDRAAMLRLFARQRGRLAAHRPMATLTVMAACGQVAAVDRLLAGSLSVLVPPVKAYWRAVAAQAVGDPAGRVGLERLLDSRDRLVALTVRQRLDAAPPAPLTPEDQALLAQEEAAVPAEFPAWIGDAPVTLVLLALNLLAYGAEVLAGGGDDDAVLFRLGGLWPGAVLDDGQWWRLGTALFLHLNLLHLGMNMVALVALGIRVERTAGPIAILFIYGTAGLASTGGVLWLTAAGILPDEALIGASGAIMGLLGALLVAGARDWRRDRSAAALRGALVMAAAVALQAVFDLLTPEVSFSAHVCGLVGGILAALAWRAAPPLPGVTLRRARYVALGILGAGAAALAMTVWRSGS